MNVKRATLKNPVPHKACFDLIYLCPGITLATLHFEPEHRNLSPARNATRLRNLKAGEKLQSCTF